MVSRSGIKIPTAIKLSKLADDDLLKLELRQKFISKLRDLGKPTRATIAAVAKDLAVSERWVRKLLARYVESDGDSTSLLPRKRGMAEGHRLLPEPVETLILQVLERRFASRQKPSLKFVHKEICEVCKQRGLRVPTAKTVSARLREFEPVRLMRLREGKSAAQALRAAGGIGLRADYPLHIVQMDHTKADLLIVDHDNRQEAQRPWLTFAIDLYSRCIVGYYVSVDAPSSTSVAICLASIAEDKRKILEKHKIETDWPISGKPVILHTDNGKEFKSKALRAGCLLHGIEIQYRPVARPHYGGVVERVMRTFMAKIHDEIPGTTRSNVKERGKYPAEKLACMTRNEFEQWLLWAIADYHASVHRSLGEPPIERLRYGLEHVQRPAPVANPKAFVTDFLPILTRRLGRTGFQLFNISYYDAKLDYYIVRRQQWPAGLEIRWDPRNLRYIWMKRPDGPGYIEVPYRDLTNPDLSEWELKWIRKDLHDKKQRVNEWLIMKASRARRKLVQDASIKSKRARRERERHLSKNGPFSGPRSPKPPTSSALTVDINVADIKPFDDLEVNQ